MVTTELAAIESVHKEKLEIPGCQAKFIQEHLRIFKQHNHVLRF